MNTIDGNSVNSLEFRRICAQYLSDCQQKPIHDMGTETSNICLFCIPKLVDTCEFLSTIQK